MGFLLLIIGGAIIFYSRFFILNSIKTKQQRSQTFTAALKVVYMIPVFQQGLLMFCTGLIYFYSTCRGFFLLLMGLFVPHWSYKLHFLYTVAFIGIAGLLLCCHFMLAKISLNKQLQGVQWLYKLAYLLFSLLMEVLMYFNLPLLYPPMAADKEMPFYSNPFVILVSAIMYLIILLLPFFNSAKKKMLQYFQLAAGVSIIYVAVTFLLGAIVFILFLLLKLVA